MERKIILVILAVVSSFVLGAASFAQEPPREVPRGPDPNNATIEGRVILPSGQSANLNVKIILSELHRPLVTIYTNKHGEFRFTTLREGEYFVKAIADEKAYEPVTQRVWLGRSLTYHLNITLRKKEEFAERKSDAHSISATELDSPAPREAKKEYAQAAQLAGKGDARQAIERFQRAITIYPDYIDARNDLGAQYLKLKRLDEAEEQFRIVLEKNPRYFNSRFNLGLVLIERKDYATAITHLNQAIAIDSAKPAPRLWLGVALLQTGDLPGAERQLTRALITGGANFAAAHYYLAQVYLRRGDSAEATRALKTYLEEAPKGEFAEEAALLLKKL
jgi:tetratricopeptide (TPR) repeat protein